MALYGNPLGGGGLGRPRRPTRLAAALQNRGLGPYPSGGPVRRPVSAGYGFGQSQGAPPGIQRLVEARTAADLGALGGGSRTTADLGPLTGGGGPLTGGPLTGAAVTPPATTAAFGPSTLGPLQRPLLGGGGLTRGPAAVSPPFRRAAGYGYMKPKQPRRYGGYGRYGFGGLTA